MLNDAIVDEVRNVGQALASRYNNDLAAICKALKDKERASGRAVVNRAPRRTPARARRADVSPPHA